MTTPDWIARRSGTLKLGSDGKTWFVLLEAKPLYSVAPTPAEGKFTSTVRQTNNGKRIESQGNFDTQDEAVQAGLEDLRKTLGWE